MVDVSSMSSKEAALTVLSDYLLDNGLLTLPVDVENLATLLGIKYEKRNFDPSKSKVSGFLVKTAKNEPFLAVTNAAEYPQRQRFTLAHEIGHYVHLYQNRPTNEVVGKVEYRNELSSAGTDPEEVWANQFAAELLMPANIVSQYWGEGLSKTDISSIFDVSIAALENRLNSLGLR